MKIKDALKNIKKSTGAESLEDSSYAEVKDFLDTGSYALNRVLTGDIYKGIPSGRISTFYGQSGSGKSLIAANTAALALKNNKVDVVYIFDSEGGTLVNIFKKHGVDMSKVNHIPVASIEQCSTKMLQTYDMLVQARQEYLADPENNDDVRAICILDSYGALAADKLVSDAVNKDKTAMDMGLGAKLKNNLMRGLMMRVVQSNATLIVINHEYQDPSAMFASKIHNMSGGLGLQFASHVQLQCEKLLIKSTDTEFMTGLEKSDDDVGFFKGNKMRFFVVKNRVCKPAYQATVYVDFNTGIAKYDGLIEDAVKMKFLEEVRGGYICKTYSDKKITYKELISNDEIWNTFIEDFNKQSKMLMEYSNSTSQALDEIEQSIEG
jgi:RecA/RadA recombinase